MAETRPPVQVIAHRGASALRPEHTLEAYAKAIADGADAIEPDLVCTRDGVLVARHENEIGATTDVAARPEFASRQTEKRIDGKAVSGWFIEDFTLAELRRLRARERLPDIRSTACDGQFAVPTFEEIVALAASESQRCGRVIGIVPELKHPTYFASLGLAMEDRLLQALAAHPYTRTAPVMIQSFEIGNLRTLRERLGSAHRNIALMQLLGKRHEQPYDAAATGRPTTFGDMSTASGLREIAGYADAIGVRKGLLDLRLDAGRPRSALVDAAHAAGLQVFAYTFRPENQYLDEAYRDGGSPAARNEAGSIHEMREYVRAGVDGLFTDDPALGRRAVDAGRMQP
jgi:glycerophosphoryl diester phosphodiesterase